MAGDGGYGRREFDVDVPSAARAYDYFLGGSHNFKADRVFANQVRELVPWVPNVARLNRSFLWRVVRFYLDHGIRQFLDLGSGIPTVGNVHEIAQQAAPGARVVCLCGLRTGGLPPCPVVAGRQPGCDDHRG